MTSALATFDRDAIRAMTPEGQRAVVSQFIEQGRNMLAQAIAASDIYGIRDAKGAASTITEMTRQLGLSKEARIDAEELVRRAEYALGKAIRKGQEDGSVYAPGKNPYRGNQHERAEVGPSDSSSRPVTDFASKGDLYSTKGNIMDLADEADREHFEDALADAKDEGNVSRANVIRKIRDQKSPETRDQRAQKVAALAAEGYTSHDIAKKMSMTRAAIKSIEQDYDLDIHADRITGKRHRLDSNRLMSGAVDSLEVIASSLRQVDPADLDPEQAQEWIGSLTESINAIRKATKSIKESIHD